MIHCFRSLRPANRSKCDHRMASTTIISFPRYRTPTIWGSWRFHMMHRRLTYRNSFTIAVTLKMRELDAELSQLSALCKSRQVVSTRAAKELLQRKVHGFTDTRVTTKAEHDFCSGKLAQAGFLCRSNVQNALATLGQDNEQLEKSNDWVSRTETYLSQVQPQSRPRSPIER